MVNIWWPTFIVPVLMVLWGFLGGHVPGLHYRSPGGKLDEARQTFANHQFWHMLRPFGAAFATMAFMVMRSVRLVPANIQTWLVYGALVLEIAGLLAMALPIERAIAIHFDEKADEGEQE